MLAALLKKQLTFTAVIVALALGLSQLSISNYLHSLWPAMVIFFTVLNIAVMALITYGNKNDSGTAVYFTLIAIVVHFILTLGFVVFLILVVVGYDLIFVLNFFLLYVCFLSFELMLMLNTLRAQN